jgi:hypothetical protein
MPYSAEKAFGMLWQMVDLWLLSFANLEAAIARIGRAA